MASVTSSPVDPTTPVSQSLRLGVGRMVPAALSGGKGQKRFGLPAVLVPESVPFGTGRNALNPSSL